MNPRTSRLLPPAVRWSTPATFGSGASPFTTPLSSCSRGQSPAQLWQLWGVDCNFLFDFT
eukprot:m.17651 g.17651  ORF g.17651 m.17651 type:complete len:60 (+) comp5207_c0_seq1:2119-2298(+)